MATLERAIELAVKAHFGQLDKAGMPYILHPLWLMYQFETLEMMITAVLHDTIEDSELSLADLRREGFSAPIIEAVDALTHRASESYDAYLQRVQENAIARRVKLADLEHNMDLRRIDQVTHADLKRLEKYHKARQFLDD